MQFNTLHSLCPPDIRTKIGMSATTQADETDNFVRIVRPFSSAICFSLTIIVSVRGNSKRWPASGALWCPSGGGSYEGSGWSGQSGWRSGRWCGASVRCCKYGFCSGFFFRCALNGRRGRGTCITCNNLHIDTTHFTQTNSRYLQRTFWSGISIDTANLGDIRALLRKLDIKITRHIKYLGEH